MRRLRFGLCVALGLIGQGGVSWAACPAGPDDPLWYLASCEISGNSRRLDASIAEAREVLNVQYPGVEIPDALLGPVALTFGSVAPVEFFPEIDKVNGENDTFGFHVAVLLGKAKIRQTDEETRSFIDALLEVKRAGDVHHNGPYVGWLDAMVHRRGYELLFLDLGGPSHGIAVVTPETFCRWVNVKLDGMVGFVGTWDAAMGVGLSDANEWSDRPHDDCAGA